MSTPAGLLQDQDFQNASDKDQHAYLSSVDHDYAQASAADQKAYRQHVTEITNPEAMLSKAQGQASADISKPIENAPNKYESVGLHQHLSTLGKGDVEEGRKAYARGMEPTNKAIEGLATVAPFALPLSGEVSLARAIPAVARTAIGSIGGGTLGAEAGSRAGGAIFGEKGREIGGALGGVGGSLLGGGLAAGLERSPATSAQSLRGEAGSVKSLPFGMQRFIPNWMVPKGELGSPTQPGPFMNIPPRTAKTFGSVGSAAQESGYYPSITKVPIRPTPSYKLTPESVPGPDTAGKGNLLSPIAKRGDPRAAQELMRRGRGVLYVPAEEYPAPKSVTRFGDEEDEEEK